MIACDPGNFNIGFQYPFNVTEGDAVEESGIVGFVLYDMLIGIIEIIFPIMEARRVAALAVFIRDVTENAAC
jgi:hypothetical protein